MTPHPEPSSVHPGVRHAHAELEPTLLASRTATATGAAAFPDISEHNGAPNWDELEAAYRRGDIAAVMIRAGFGTVRADNRFATNQAECRRRGIPAMYYWFCYPAYNSAAAEAAMFNRVVGQLQPNEAMCGDFEDDPGALPFPRGAAGLQWATDFLSLLQAPRNATWGYSYPYLISTVGLQPLWQTWPFWLADYSATPDSAFGYPIARQFTDCASVPGISGCCDLSRVLKAPLSQWLTGGSAPIVTPSPRRSRRMPNPITVDFEPDKVHEFRLMPSDGQIRCLVTDKASGTYLYNAPIPGVWDDLLRVEVDPGVGLSVVGLAADGSHGLWQVDWSYDAPQFTDPVAVQIG